MFLIKKMSIFVQKKKKDWDKDTCFLSYKFLLSLLLFFSKEKISEVFSLIDCDKKK